MAAITSSVSIPWNPPVNTETTDAAAPQNAPAPDTGAPGAAASANPQSEPASADTPAPANTLSQLLPAWSMSPSIAMQLTQPPASDAQPDGVQRRQDDSPKSSDYAADQNGGGDSQGAASNGGGSQSDGGNSFIFGAGGFVPGAPITGITAAPYPASGPIILPDGSAVCGPVIADAGSTSNGGAPGNSLPDLVKVPLLPMRIDPNSTSSANGTLRPLGSMDDGPMWSGPLRVDPNRPSSGNGTIRPLMPDTDGQSGGFLKPIVGGTPSDGQNAPIALKPVPINVDAIDSMPMDGSMVLQQTKPLLFDPNGTALATARPIFADAKSTPADGTNATTPAKGPDAAAPANATTPANATAPAAPTASSVERNALELMLAAPDIQETIKNFGGPLITPPPTKTGVEKSIVARYGPDLAARLNQLQVAQEEVRKQYCQTLDAAINNAGPKQPGSVFVVSPTEWSTGTPSWCIDTSGNVLPMPDVTIDTSARADRGVLSVNWHNGKQAPDAVIKCGSGASVTIGSDVIKSNNQVFVNGVNNSDFGSWKFDPVAFTNTWSQGDSDLQKAFTALYGSQGGMQAVMTPRFETTGPLVPTGDVTLAGRVVQIRQQFDGEGSAGGFKSSIDNGDETLVDPKDPPSLINKDMVWFDPAFGWMTDPNNIKGDWLDKVGPALFGAFASFVTGGIAGPVVGGMIGSAATQLAANGKIDFGSVLKGAVTAGLANGILNSDAFVNAGLSGADSTVIGRMLGQAGVRGTLAELTGGKFLDGALQGVTGELADQVSRYINTEVANSTTMSASERSVMNLLSRASASAIRALGNPGDPAAAFASDFLDSALREHQNSTNAKPADAASAAGQGGASSGDASSTSRGVRDFDPDGKWDPNALVPNVGADGSPTADAGEFATGEGYTGGMPADSAAGAGGNGIAAPAMTPQEWNTMTPQERVAFVAANGLSNASAGINGQAPSLAYQQFLNLNLDMMNQPGPISPAAQYSQFVEYQFEFLTPDEQWLVLQQLNQYANLWHAGNGNLETGLASGDMEARRADLAVRMAADQAHQSGAIPAEVHFNADFRLGFNEGLGALFARTGGRFGGGALGEGVGGTVSQADLNALIANGVNFTPGNVMATGKTPSGQTVFLETGNSNAGFQHIVEAHAAEFASMGVSLLQIPDVVMRAVTQGTIVGYQGSGTGRPIYRVIVNGQPQLIAITIGSNGFIVGANPRGSVK